ncbi:co-chaperone GroES [Spirobacillus cienkowskii]|jgi:chaperonin GroES|uniref:Co-chaperonin GroES n=1 Tax=Spirobacillus cienkowskii TaxID=495820 RepID=A0A369KRS2_9BACT|nr:MAG: co-chaperone GroES [Spirobacillus cienkowskii]
MNKSIRPLNDRILLKRIEAEQKTAGGILIPDNAKEKPLEGKVIAVGNGKILENGTHQTPDVKTGDKVLFGKWSGNEIKIDGEEFLLVKEDEILAVIEA